ncbi:MAG: inositol phosphorylceramide synthase [Muribaculaceae bacterium]|nr:inositol phosphorylceramide synthase [Muribaculaceae bacterium]
MRLSMPSLRESVLCAAGLLLWLVVTALFVGFRPEHVVLALLIFALFFFNVSTRRLVIALVPFFLFGISYDWMNILPNYKVNPVDVAGLYETEKSLFGIATAEGVLTPNEFFGLHHTAFVDFLAGIFYLCWVPLPVVFGLYLYFSRRTEWYLHFAIVFLLVNLLGFAIYYIHPAAPPWYVALHGFEAVEGTPGDVAGLGRFDDMTGLGIFNALYARNSNVFAAVPSLHSAYTFVAFIYALLSRAPKGWTITLGVVSAGIWFTAVYTSHHYIIDVLLGIGTALAGIALFEWVLMRLGPVARFVERYAGYVGIKA